VAHVAPYIVVGGRSLQGQSLGFHAYSLRVDNLSNQWLQEETTLAWIPPYSLGVVLRLYGTQVALLLNTAPIGQPQPSALIGEYAVVVYSDELRVDVPGAPVRQFTLVQAVSDLTQGPEPALPPTGVDRLWADTSGNIHHVHSNGVDCQLVDPCQSGVLIQAMFATGSVTSSAILDGTIQTVDIGNQQITPALLAPGAAASNVGALGGSLSGSLPSPAQVYQGAALGAAVGLSAGVWQTAVNLNLLAGTYVIWAVAQLVNGAGGAGHVQARITDGVTVRSSGAFSFLAASGGASIPLPPVVITPGGLTTYALQGYCSIAGGQVFSISAITGEAGATQIFALRLA